jgi:hypothetical protein
MPHHPSQTPSEQLFPVISDVADSFGVGKDGKQIQPYGSWKLGQLAKFGGRLKRRAEYAAERALALVARPGVDFSDTPQTLNPMRYGRPITHRAGQQYSSGRGAKRVPAPRLVGVEPNPGPDQPGQRKKRFNKVIHPKKQRNNTPNRATMAAAVQAIARTARAGRKLAVRGRARPMRATRIPTGLTPGQAPPSIVRTADGRMHVTHTEHITLLSNSSTAGAFRIDWFNLNPGDPKTFPWLSGLASNFERYKFNRVRFVVRPLLGYVTTSQQIGSVCAVFNNDIADAVFEDYIEMANFGGFAEFGAVSGGSFPCTTKGLSNPSEDGSYYRVNGTAEDVSSIVPAGTTVHEYYPGRFMIASYGFSTGPTQFARLSVEYDCTFIKPMLPDDSDLLYWHDLWNPAPTTAANFSATTTNNLSIASVLPTVGAARWRGTNGSVVPGPQENPDYTITTAGNVVFRTPGTYFVIQYAQGVSLSVASPTVGTALDLVNGLFKGTTSNVSVTQSGGANIMRVITVRCGSTTGISTAGCTLTIPVTIASGGTLVELHVLRIPSLSPTDYTPSLLAERQSGREIVAAMAAFRSSKDEAVLPRPSSRSDEECKGEPFSPSYEVVDPPRKAPTLKARF